MNILGALVISLAGVLQVAGVLDSDLVSDLGNSARAFLENGLGDTHDCGGTREVAVEI